MRRILPSLVALVLGCSSKAAGPTVDSPTVVLPAASSTAPTVASAPAILAVAAPPPSVVRVVRLPDQPYDPLYPTYRSIDWAKGELPGPAFPAGTVYVVTADPTPNDPVSVTEWDLGRSAIVRSIELPVSHEGLPWILRVGDQLHVLVQSWESLSLVRLTKDLRIEGVVHWKDHVALPGVGAFSADAKVTVVAYPGDISDKGQGLVLATFDGAGKRRGTRTIWGVESPDRNAVVVGGRVFVLLSELKKGVELLALGPDLRLEKRVIVSPEPAGNLSLETREGRLQAITGYPVGHAIEFSTSLERLGGATPVEDPQYLELGDEKVHMCGGHKGHCWLAWTTSSEDPCAASPADLRSDAPDDP